MSRKTASILAAAALLPAVVALPSPTTQAAFVITPSTATPSARLNWPSPQATTTSQKVAADGHVCSPWCGCRRQRAFIPLYAKATETDEGEASATEEDKTEAPPEDPEKAALNKEIQEWEKKVKDLKNQVSQKESKLKTVGKEGYYRLAAEVETYKRRRGDALKVVKAQAVEETLESLLEALDAFDEAEAFYAQEGVEEGKERSLLNGYLALQKGVLTKMEKFGLKAISSAVGEKAEYGKHDIVERRTMDDKPDNTILEVHNKGYQTTRGVIRPSKVVVSITSQTLKKEEEAAKKKEEELAKKKAAAEAAAKEKKEVKAEAEEGSEEEAAAEEESS